MTPDKLLELIAAGETEAVEFKGEEGKPFSDQDLVESVVCLANRSGGSAADYSALEVADARWDDLDPLEFERYRRLARESGVGDQFIQEVSDLDLAKALGAVDGTHTVRAVRVLGLLLFGREEALRRFLPTHEVAFQVLDGTDLRANAFFRWPLLRAMEEIVKRFEARNNEEELNIGPLRISIPDYSPRAFREAVANALVHRDYTRLGAVHVQWHSDRLEVSNPGGFPEGVGLNNFLVAPPRPRNPLLADAFKRAGLVERTGRGIDTIFYEQLRHGRPSPHYDRTTANDVVLVVPGGRANLNFVRLIVKENDRRGKSLSLDELLVMNTLWLQRRLDVHEAARLTQKSVAEARSALERLTESGLVEGRGERRGRVYHLARSIYERFGDAEGHARQRGLAPEEAERKLLEHAMAGERVTRGFAAELLGLSPSQATRLLARLVAEGKLERKGRGKGTWYEAAG